MYKDSKKRSLAKTIIWRLVATLNSFIILVTIPTSIAIYLAIAMNITGFLIYYIYERIWNKIKWGKVVE